MKSGGLLEAVKFWFGKVHPTKEGNFKLWFGKSPELDLEISTKFKSLYHEIESQESKLSELKLEPMEALGCVIVLDQYARNMFRDTPKAFENDYKALELCKYWQSRLNTLPPSFGPYEKMFFLMPLMHSEVLQDQDLQVDEFTRLANTFPEMKGTLKFGQDHRDIIHRFGRFPHRNKILGRVSTKEEEEFLTTPNSSF